MLDIPMEDSLQKQTFSIKFHNNVGFLPSVFYQIWAMFYVKY